MQASLFFDSDSSTIQVAGEIDVAVCDALLAAGTTALWPPHPLQLDMSGVTFIDARGLGALIILRRRAADAGCRLVMLRPSAPTRRLLDLTATADLFADQRPAPALTAGRRPD